DGVVDLVRAGVQQIFALQVNTRTAEVRGEASGKLQGRGASGEIFQQGLKFVLKLAIRLGLFVGTLQFVQRHHQRFGNVAASVGAKTARDRGGDSELAAHVRNPYCTLSAASCSNAKRYAEVVLQDGKHASRKDRRGLHADADGTPPHIERFGMGIGCQDHGPVSQSASEINRMIPESLVEAFPDVARSTNSSCSSTISDASGMRL